MTPSCYPSLCIAWKSGDLQNHHHKKSSTSRSVVAETDKNTWEKGHKFQLPQIRTEIYKNSFINRYLFKLVWSYSVMFDHPFLSLFISCCRYQIVSIICDFACKLTSLESDHHQVCSIFLSQTTNTKLSLIFHYKPQFKISKCKYSNH